MNPQHTERECACTDHRYWQFTLMWCPYRMQWSLSRSTYVETGTDETDPNWEYQRVDFGPFDQMVAVLDELYAWVDDSLQEYVGSPPRLPGS